MWNASLQLRHSKPGFVVNLCMPQGRVLLNTSGINLTNYRWDDFAKKLLADKLRLAATTKPKLLPFHFACNNRNGSDRCITHTGRHRRKKRTRKWSNSNSCWASALWQSLNSSTRRSEFESVTRDFMLMFNLAFGLIVMSTR